MFVLLQIFAIRNVTFAYRKIIEVHPNDDVINEFRSTVRAHLK